MGRVIIALLVGCVLSSGYAVNDLAGDWSEYQKANGRGKVRTATNVLARIETRARELRAWPDLASALMQRTRLEYGIAEENALDAERKTGFVAQYAARVEASPAEVRPMLRLALAHDYLSMRDSMRWWKDGCTQLANATNQPPWAAERIVPTLHALFDAIAADRDALLAQKVEDWKRLVNCGDAYALSCRPTLWDFAVNDAVDFSGRVDDADKTLRAKTLGWLDGLAAAHPVDREPDAHVHALYRKVQLVGGDKIAFAEKWFDVSAVSAEAARAGIGPLAQSAKGEDRVRAHEIALRFHARWPKSCGGRDCLSLAKSMEQPSFSLNVENHLLPQGEKIAVSSRNLTNLCFRIVPVTFAELQDPDFQEARGSYSKDNLATWLRKWAARKPAAAWTVAIADKGDFLSHESETEIPADIPFGYYIVFAATNDAFGTDGRPCHYALVSRTDLFVTRRSGKGGWSGYVYDAQTGFPRGDVAVEYWMRAKRGRGYKLRSVSTTRADGFWEIQEQDREHDSGFVRAVVLQKGGILPGTKEVQGTLPENVQVEWSSFALPTELERLHLVTDRSIYRPGQTVKFKGYAYHADPRKRDFRALGNRRVYVDFLDVNRKKVGSLALISNDFGTFNGEFTAPRDRLTGRYSINVRMSGGNPRNDVSTSSSVNVEEYKRSKFTASFEHGTFEGLRLGAETKLKGRALSYTGLPVSGAKVKWSVRRQTYWPSWWNGYRGGDDRAPVASGEAVTDAEGRFVCVFTPAASTNAQDVVDATFNFSCSAQVTDASGEMHAAATSFTIGNALWRIGVCRTDDDSWNGGWKAVSEGTQWRVSLRTVDGKPVVDAAAVLKVHALVQPERPVRKALRGGGSSGNGRGRDLSDPRRWEKGPVVATVPVKTDAEGRATGSVSLPVGAYRLVAEAKTPDGRTIHDESFTRVVDPAAKTYAVREPIFVQFEKSTVKVGGTARMFFGTGYDSGHSRVVVTQGDKVLAEREMRGPCWMFEFPVENGHRGSLLFETTFVRENRLYHEQHSVYVPWDDHDLKITREHMTSKLLPDATETWRFRISGTDTNDVRRGVEALAFMYDKSLDALRRHSPGLPFDSSFSLSAIWRSWYNPNTVLSFDHWCGGWPSIPSGGSVVWHQWVYGAMGLFDRVSNGWRGGPVVMSSVGAMAPGMPRVVGPRVPGSAVRRRSGARGAFAAAACSMDCAAAPAPEAKAAEAAPADDGGSAVPDVKVRTNLAETAFFLPTLVSDEKGVVEFSFKVPQALTGWKFFLLAHDAKLANGRLVDEEVVTVKPLMVEPNGPRFVREGDSLLFPVKVSNTADEPQRGKVSLEFFDAESGKPVNLGAERDFAFDLKPGESRTFEFPIAVPDGCGHLRAVAKAAGAEFTDGEEGFLPVLSRRIMVQEAMPLQIRRAGEKAFDFEKLRASGASETLRHVGVTAQVVSDPSWYAFLALPYLMEYPHECNEQVFGRFYANALAARIANANPEYRKTFEQWEQADANALKSPLELNEDLKQVMLDATPWVREAANETRARRHIAELFGSARLDAEQARALRKLRQNVGSDGLWPWFPGGPGSSWVTMHILTGFARLRALGAKGSFLDAGILGRARAALDRVCEKDIAERLRRKKQFPFRIHGGDLRWLYLQSFDKSWNGKYAKLLFDHLRKEWTSFGISGQSLAAITLLRRGDGALAREIVQSLKERAVRSEEKGLYWKRGTFFDCSLYGAPVSDQAIAMEAFVEVEPEDRDAYEDARIWMLEQKRTQNWSSTVATVDAVYAILLGRGRTAPAKVGPVTMTLGGAEVPRADAEAGTGFYEHRYTADEVKPAMGEIRLSRKEEALGWASVHWTYLESVEKVTAHEQKDLRLVKTYYKKTRVNGQVRLVELGGGEKLQPGDELVSRLAIDSDRILEFVHLRDERPASAEPVDVISRYRWQDGLGYYQSTRDTATHYYFDRFPRGNFVLETSYRVRQKGTFTGGLATIECMYAPEFRAHSAAQVIQVQR